MPLQAIETFMTLMSFSTLTHQITFLPGFDGARHGMGKIRAGRAAALAIRNVPAYRSFLRDQDVDPIILRNPAKHFEDLPEMDKETYIKRWSIQARSQHGSIRHRGVLVDESSGTSGKPTNWVRGKNERAANKRLLRLTYSQMAAASTKPVFVINAFSLGSWTTGINVTLALADVAITKSVGPDIDKIIGTLNEFGANYKYVILSYPPLVKSLFDDQRIQWDNFDIVVAFGGEGISEQMRAKILRHADQAFGSYGAADLQITLARETPLTVELRNRISRNAALAKDLIDTQRGTLPMIFQYNPYDYHFETNSLGELVVTVCRKQTLNPRIRYNIHDLGHTIRLRDLRPVLRRHGCGDLLAGRHIDLPLLFHYGRSDLSINYNRAVVSPESLAEVIHKRTSLFDAVENFRLICFEDQQATPQLHVAVQLSERATSDPEINRGLLREILLDDLRELNRDFDHAIISAPESALPTVAIYGYRSGPFRGDGTTIKNQYVWKLSSHELNQWNLDLSFVATR